MPCSACARQPRSQQPAPSQCSMTDASKCQRSQLCSLKLHQQYGEAIRSASHRTMKWSSSNCTSLRKRSAAARCSSRSARRCADRHQTCQTHRLASELTAPTPAHLDGIYLPIWGNRRGKSTGGGGRPPGHPCIIGPRLRFPASQLH